MTKTFLYFRSHRITALALLSLPSFCLPYSLQGETIRIGFPAVVVTTLPLPAAKDLGYFQQEGLTVNLVLIPGSLSIQALLSKDLDYSAAIGSGVLAAVRGIDTRVIMCFDDRPPFDLVASPEISSIADLKSRVIGINRRGGLMDIVARRMLTQSGVDPANVTFLALGGQSEIILALRTRRIAAGLLSPPQNFLAYKDGLKNLGFAGRFLQIPGTGLVTLNERLEKTPDQVTRVIRAVNRARVFYRQNKAAVLPIMGRFLRQDDPALLSEIYDYQMNLETRDGRVEANVAAETIRQTLETEGINRNIPVNRVFDFSQLPQS